MRIRSRITPSTRARDDLYYDGLTDQFTTQSVPAGPPRRLQYMRDDEQWHNIFNDCFNSRVDINVGGHYAAFTPNLADATYFSWLRDDGLNTGVCEIPTEAVMQQALLAYPEFYRQANSGQWATKRYGYDAWILEKWPGPRPSLDRGFSLINFLLEYASTKQLVHSWVSKRALLNRWHNLMSRNRTLGQRAQAAADERLAHVYGTKLFIRDAYTLWKILTEWKSRADRYLAQAGFLQKSYKRPYAIARTGDTFLGYRPCPILGIDPSFMGMTINHEYVSHAVLGYTYSVPEMKGAISRLAQLSDSLGIRLDASIAWDAVTLSFVVDWFINIGEWLHENANLGDLVKAEVRLVDYCTSAKVSEGRTLTWRRPWIASDGHLLGGFPIDIASANATWYDRKRRDPPVFTKAELALYNEPWKFNRIINATALAVSRGSRTNPQRAIAKGAKALARLAKQSAYKSKRIAWAIKRGYNNAQKKVRQKAREKRLNKRRN